MKDISANILSYLTECVNAESREAFMIPENDQKIYFLEDIKKDIKEFFFSDETYLSIIQTPSIVEFFKRKNTHNKSDKIYLAIDYVLDRSGQKKYIVPLYIVEILVDFNENEYRLSKVDYEPTFNYSLLSGDISINETVLLADEISEEQSWNKKVSIFFDKFRNGANLTTHNNPFIFTGNIFQVAQSSVTRELEWIKSKYLDEIDNTSLSLLLNKDSKIWQNKDFDLKYIEIFQSNKIQHDVIKYALNNRFTVITGPPGTGKSQVVLNLLANIYFNNMTALFASKNNKAVNTVLDKLESIQDGYCPFVRLGNKQEKMKGLNKIVDSIQNEINSKGDATYSKIENLVSEIDIYNKDLAEIENNFKQYCIVVKKFEDKKREMPIDVKNCLNDKSFCMNIGRTLHRCDRLQEELNDNIKLRKKDSDLHDAKLTIKESYLRSSENLIKNLPKILREILIEDQTNKLNSDSIEIFKKLKDEISHNMSLFLQSKNELNEKLNEEKNIVYEINKKKHFILNFNKSHFNNSLSQILLDKEVKRLKTDLNIDILRLKKLKTNLNSELRNEVSLLHKIVKLFIPSYYKNIYFKELGYIFNQLPNYIRAYLSVNLTDISANSLLDAVHTIEEIFEFSQLASELDIISERYETIGHETKRTTDEMHALNDANLIKRLDEYLAGIPNRMTQFYMNDATKSDIKIESYLNFLKCIEKPLNNIVEINLIKNEVKTISDEVLKLEKRLSDEYFRPFYTKTDKFLSNLPKEVNEYVKNQNDILTLDRIKGILIALLNLLGDFSALIELKKNVGIYKAKITQNLDSSAIEAKIHNARKNLVEISREMFNRKVYDNINKSKAKFIQSVKDYYGNWKDNILITLLADLTKYLGILVTTNLSTRFNIPNRPNIFDYVIIDEASQNDLPSVLPLLFRAKNAIIIGDPNQLRHITSLKDKDVEAIAIKHQLKDELIDFHYNKNSAYDTAQRRFIGLTGQEPFILRYHYRCHKDIIGFSNDNFYNGELFPKSYLKQNVSPFKLGITWNNIKGKYQDKCNPNEAAAIVDVIKKIKNQGVNEAIEIGIITPFNNQKRLITQLLLRNKLISGRETDPVFVSTVHSFQGDEKDIILYSPVMCHGIANKTLAWLDHSTDLLNVALTRAKSALIIFGDSEFCSKTTGMHKRLLNYCFEIEKRTDNPVFESPTEEHFYRELMKSGIQFEYQVPINRYRIDFMIKMDNKYLCIELDGGQHQKKKSYDYSRDKYLEGLGHDIIRVPNNFIEKNSSEFIETLKSVCSSENFY